MFKSALAHSCCLWRQRPIAYGEDIIVDCEYYADLMTLQTFCVFNYECYCVITCHDMDLCSAKRFARPNIHSRQKNWRGRKQ